MTRDPVTIFYGPPRGFEDLAQWPPTIQAHLQLHGLQPGDETTPPLPPSLFTPKLLTPSATPGAWQFIAFPFNFFIIHTPLQRLIRVFTFFGDFDIFRLSLPFAVNLWAYNALTDPAGNFAFGGSATLSWKEP